MEIGVRSRLIRRLPRKCSGICRRYLGSLSSEEILLKYETCMKTLFATLFTCTLTISASATPLTVTFDDGNYGGLQWNNFGFINGTLYPAGSGFVNGVVSPNNVAYTYNGMPASISSSQPFNFLSGYLTGAWKDGLQVEVQGFVGTTLTYDRTYILSINGPTFIPFNYLGVDNVVFTRSGGTLEFDYINPPGDVVVMDNLTVDPSPVPEPGTLSVLSLSVAMMMVLHRRKWCVD